ncbi:MAG: alpha/beta hydrolase [Sphingomonadales bacterium]|nr:MAG: alpha/beta hydrolase [Sphingomonadales bacterium]
MRCRALSGSSTALSDSDHALVDAELLPLVAMLPSIRLSSETLAEYRARPATRAPLSDAASAVTVEERFIPGRAGDPDVRLFLYRPDATGSLPVVLHIHAGGFVVGALDGGETRAPELAAAMDCVVVSVDYRLAPETRFPGALEDCYAALKWVVREAASLGIDPLRIVVKGESAGGGLAAALALLARDRGEFAILGQHLTYPMLDDRTGVARKCPDYAGALVWTLPDNLFGWESLLGHPAGDGKVSPYAAPARASDLTALPPTFLMVGALDLFADEGVEYARRLLAAGVATELHVYPGAFHGFDLSPDASVARAARAAAHRWLSRQFADAAGHHESKDDCNV